MRGTDVPDRKLMRARISVIALALAVILAGCSSTEKEADVAEPTFSALAEYE